MNISKHMFIALAVFYAALFISCLERKETDDSLLMKKEKNFMAAANYLLEKHNTKLLVDSSATFTKQYQDGILASRTVVLDTVVKSLDEIDGHYYLNVEIAGNDSLSVYASLKCTEEIREEYFSLKKNSLLIAADITSVEKFIDEYVSGDKILGEDILLKREKILLLGNCLEIFTRPTIFDYNEEKSRG